MAAWLCLQAAPISHYDILSSLYAVSFASPPLCRSAVTPEPLSPCEKRIDYDLASLTAYRFAAMAQHDVN